MYLRRNHKVTAGLVLILTLLWPQIIVTPLSAQTGAPPPLIACSGGCPGWYLYHSNRSGNWEIYLDDLDPNTPDAPLDLSQGGVADADNVEPTLATNKNWIAFSSNRDGNWEIYVAKTDGSDVRRVTFNTEAKDVNPSWADSNTLIYQSSVSGAWDLYEFDMTTGDITRVTSNPGDDVNPYWSPSTWQVVYESNRSGIWQIYVLDRVTGASTLLSDGAGDDHNPVFSPDGTKILFRSTRDGNSVLYVMNADGTGLTPVSDPAGNAYNATWSPDGSTISYESDLDGDTDIYLYNVGNDLNEKITFNDVDDFAAAWHCDNTLLYNSGETSTPQIFHTTPPNVDGVEDPTLSHQQLTFEDVDNLFATGDAQSEEIASKYNAMTDTSSLPSVGGTLPSYPIIGLQPTSPESVSVPDIVWEAIDGCS